MTADQFADLIKLIKAGKLTVSQMEDVVYALHHAYVDHHEEINEQLSISLEHVADTMVVARRNLQKMDWEPSGPSEDDLNDDRRDREVFGV